MAPLSTRPRGGRRSWKSALYDWEHTKKRLNTFSTGTRMLPPELPDHWRPHRWGEQRDPYILERYDLLRDRFTQDQMNWWMLTLGFEDRFLIWSFEYDRRKLSAQSKLDQAIEQWVETMMVGFKVVTEATTKWLNEVCENLGKWKLPPGMS